MSGNCQKDPCLLEIWVLEARVRSISGISKASIDITSKILLDEIECKRVIALAVSNFNVNFSEISIFPFEFISDYHRVTFKYHGPRTLTYHFNPRKKKIFFNMHAQQEPT